MLADCTVPLPLRPDGFAAVERRGVAFAAGRWTAAGIERLVEHLARRGPAVLDRLSRHRLLAAWESTVAALLAPDGEARRRLLPPLSRLCGLSPPGLAAALDTLLAGARGATAAALARSATTAADRRPTVVFLAGNLPALALQALFPALLCGRPVLLKSSSAEPLSAPWIAGELLRHEAALADAMAVLAWPGGDRSLEAPVLAAASRVVAYGDASTLADLSRRTGDRLVAFGPAISLAVLGAEVPPTTVAEGLARDIALFDQRGCLSVHAVYTAGNAVVLAEALATALRRRAELWPPGPLDAAVAAAVQQLRGEADLRGLHRPAMPLAAGTVVVEPLPELLPSPGLRSVRIHPLSDLAALPDLLRPWHGRLQGIAVAGAQARALEASFGKLGVSRCSAPGTLHHTDFSWRNGGLSPLEAFGG